jgi:hypothetical protein
LMLRPPRSDTDTAGAIRLPLWVSVITDLGFLEL